jgi:hypothetical protein
MKSKWGVVVHAYNPITREAEAGGSRVLSHPGFHRKTLSPKNEVGTIFIHQKLWNYEEQT